ncbi:MAG: hypothetical protein AMS20_16420 [Gemmatimonas sp. SG8_28]|nr:MAG: hypothetical protein AMS20_16420 [Gemmatimonas sp. SG8_28]
MKSFAKCIAIIPMLACVLATACGSGERAQSTATLSDEQVQDIVRRSYQYVAMYNVNNKFAQVQGGWNTLVADTRLKDHTMRTIARPNNDTFYVSGLLDLRHDPVILEIPAFDSKYVSLMITGYDHYVSIPMSTRQGDFRTPERILIYSARTEGYDGEPVEGIDRLFEATGDFVSAVFRIMPHANEPERLARVREQAQRVALVTLSTTRRSMPTMRTTRQCSRRTSRLGSSRASCTTPRRSQPSMARGSGRPPRRCRGSGWKECWTNRIWRGSSRSCSSRRGRRT